MHKRVSNVRAVTNPAAMHNSDKYRVKTKTRLNTKSIFIRKVSELAPYSAILTRSFCLAALQAPEGSLIGDLHLRWQLLPWKPCRLRKTALGNKPIAIHPKKGQ